VWNRVAGRGRFWKLGRPAGADTTVTRCVTTMLRWFDAAPAGTEALAGGSRTSGSGAGTAVARTRMAGRGARCLRCSRPRGRKGDRRAARVRSAPWWPKTIWEAVEPIPNWPPWRDGNRSAPRGCRDGVTDVTSGRPSGDDSARRRPRAPLSGQWRVAPLSPSAARPRATPHAAGGWKPYTDAVFSQTIRSRSSDGTPLRMSSRISRERGKVDSVCG